MKSQKYDRFIRVVKDQGYVKFLQENQDHVYNTLVDCVLCSIIDKFTFKILPALYQSLEACAPGATKIIWVESVEMSLLQTENRKFLSISLYRAVHAKLKFHH